MGKVDMAVSSRHEVSFPLLLYIGASLHIRFGTSVSCCPTVVVILIRKVRKLLDHTVYKRGCGERIDKHNGRKERVVICVKKRQLLGKDAYSSITYLQFAHSFHFKSFRM